MLRQKLQASLKSPAIADGARTIQLTNCNRRSLQGARYSFKVRAQTSRHSVFVICVALSQAAMHSGKVLPAAPPPGKEDPPLVAMTSPWVPMIAAVAGAIAAEARHDARGATGGSDSQDPTQTKVRGNFSLTDAAQLERQSMALPFSPSVAGGDTAEPRPSRPGFCWL